MRKYWQRFQNMVCSIKQGLSQTATIHQTPYRYGCSPKCYCTSLKLSQFDNQRGKSGDTPKSKLLFISKLVYFTKLTRNEAYNDNDDNIKKIIKQYKDTKINTISPIYG